MLAALKFSALGDIASAVPYFRAMDPTPCIITSPLGKAYLQDEFSDFIVLDKTSFRSHIDAVREVRRRKFSDIVDFQGNKRCKLIGKTSGSRVHDAVTHFVQRSSPPPYVAEIIDRAVAQMECKPKQLSHIIFNAGSSPRWTSKRLPIPKWCEFAEILNERLGLPIKLVGSAEERPYIQSIVDELPGEVENLAGGTGFPELKKVIREATLTVSTDSAALHISKSEGTPTIGLFGATALGGKMRFPWTVGIYDRVRFPEGDLPIADPEPRAYYDHIDLQEGLDALEKYLP